MEWMIFYIGVLLFLVLGLYLELKTRKVYRHFLDTRTGKPIPVAAGYFSGLLITLRSRFDVCFAEKTKELGLLYGPYYANFALEPVVTFTDPEDIKTVLKKIDDFPKKGGFTTSFDHVKVLVGPHNILRQNNPEWHDQRSLLNKAFTSNRIFFQPMCQKINVLMSKWEIQEVCVGHDLQKLTLDILASCIFGFDFDSLNGKLSEPLNAYNYSFENGFHPIRLLLPWANKLPLPMNKELNHHLSNFDQFCWEIMDQTKKKIQEKKSHGDTDHAEDETEKSMIELMYENGLPEEIIRDNVSMFFIAGHETTATSLGWILSVIATRPDVQHKARQEILDKLPNEFTFDSLKELPYIDGLIKESSRMYPPVAVVGGRISIHDTTIGNVQIPAGTSIELNLIAMCHDPKIWGDPETIRPERWFPENLTKEQRSAWMPFSTGPRVCIGMNFSLFEQKIFLIYLFKRFKEIKLAPQGKIKTKFLRFYSLNTDKLILQLTM